MPTPTKSVRSLKTKFGMYCLFSCRSTSTWKLPCAPTYLLRSWMDCNSTGPLRSVVSVANGLRSLGIRLAAMRANAVAATRPTTPMKTRIRRPQCAFSRT